MSKKYFVWSFDDGLEQDKRIIEILKEYNMGATFHLNSGLYGERTYEGRIGNLGFKEVPEEKFYLQKRHFVPYVPHFRIPEDEVCQVYEGFEIAAHTCTHKKLSGCSEQELRNEIVLDVHALSEKFKQDIVGFSYPYGIGAEKSEEILKEAGVMYARTIKTNQEFVFPDNPLRLPMNGWHLSSKVFDYLDQFFKADAEKEDRLFLMFAHGYEFDFETKESSWDKFKRICETVSTQEDIVCCSIGDAFKMHFGL